TQTYAQAMARPDMGWRLGAPSPAGGTTTNSGWDPVRKVVITRGVSAWAKYDPKTDTWTRLNDSIGGGDKESGVAVDAVGRKMYVIGNVAEVIDLDTYVVTSIG